MQKGVTSEEGQVTMSTRGLPVIARQFHKRLSLAAAAFLIRDGDIPGHNITILEESAKIGGSLDAAGTTTDGYVMRGGRMLESKYPCTYDLFSSIPTLD